jgi:hypothetical protein
MGTELEHRDFLRFSHLSVTYLGRPQFFKVGMGPIGYRWKTTIFGASMKKGKFESIGIW